MPRGNGRKIAIDTALMRSPLPYGDELGHPEASVLAHDDRAVESENALVRWPRTAVHTSVATAARMIMMIFLRAMIGLPYQN